MPIIEKLIGVVSPVECVGCGNEGESLCSECTMNSLAIYPSSCFWCKKLTKNYLTCRDCRSKSRLYSMYSVSNYSETVKNLVYALKFDRQRAASFSVANLLAQGLNDYNQGQLNSLLVCPVPTATSRIRERSFDHAKLITKNFCQETKLVYLPVLRRIGQSRQVGSSRKLRLENLKDAFFVPPRLQKNIAGQEVLLVDDIVTTGATLECCARALKQAGASQVHAIVLAHKELGK